MQSPVDLGNSFCEPFDGSILSICGAAKTNLSEVKILGSGFIICPYLAVTAKHVIEEYVSVFDVNTHGKVKKELPGNTFLHVSEAPFHLSALSGPLHNLGKYQFDIDLVSLSDFSDFALIRLVPKFDVFAQPWRPSRLSALGPAKSEPVLAYGLVARPSDCGLDVGRDLKAFVAPGKVTEHYEVQRDRGFIYFPSFATNAHTDGGMSGGPVTHANSLVVGMVSGSIQLPVDEEHPSLEYITYVASMWPLLGSAIELAVDGSPAMFSIADLLKRNLMRMEHTDGFSVHYNEVGIAERVAYRRPK